MWHPQHQYQPTQQPQPQQQGACGQYVPGWSATPQIHQRHLPPYPATIEGNRHNWYLIVYSFEAGIAGEISNFKSRRMFLFVNLFFFTEYLSQNILSSAL